MNDFPAGASPVAGRLGSPSSPVTARWVRWAPFAVIAVDFVFEVTLPSRFASGFLLIAVPVLAAFTRRARTVAALVVVSLGLELLFARRFDHVAEVHHIGLYIATVVIGVISIELARQRQRDARNLVQAKSVAEALQLMLLRPIPAELGPVRAAGFYQAADGRALVGGDLYDLSETPFGVRVVIGDVRGNGLAAIRHVGAVLSCFRDTAYEISDLADLADHMERRLVRESETVGDAELFVTALFLEFPPDRQEVRIVDRGHPAPIVLRHGHVSKLATRPGVPLGLGALAAAPDEPVGATTHPLGADEVLVLHTDGVSEARGADGAFYPTEERLALRFGGRSRIAPATVAAFLRDDLADYVDGAAVDDVAVVALARSAGP